mmetsp:Transcript_17590/g.70644  ORF Transcript_17590/g.70644 Transcript_17590/m.70644 type:complete len:111 (-) Transcript_17590:1431-1763(-)
MSYHKQVEESKPRQAEFIAERLPRYFGHFERALEASGGPYFLGADLSYVDLQVMVMLHVTRQQWPDAWAELASTTIPRLVAFLATVEALPPIKAYLESPRKHPFAGDSLM